MSEDRTNCGQDTRNRNSRLTDGGPSDGQRMFQPLADAVILDLTRLLPGAYCTRLLAEYGAEVVKIEEPTHGDYAREIPPYDRGWSYRHTMDNFDKLSVCLDLKADDGVDIFRDLVVEADVLVENFRPGVMDRLGIDYETVSSWNETIVYCSISGYGQTGPYRDLPGHDLNYLSVAGIVALTGQSEGPPAVPGGMFADVSAGVHGALGVLAGVLERERTGYGEYVDISMTDVSLAPLLPHLAVSLGAGEPPRRGAGRYLGSPCYDVYETGDGAYLSIAAMEPKFWERLCDAIDRPDLIPLHPTDDRAERDTVREALETAFANRSRDEWLSRLREADVPVAPVNEVDEVIANEQIQARDMITDVPHPEGGTIKTTGHPINYGNELQPPDEPAPAIGEHTTQILGELGYTKQQVADLAADGVIAGVDTREGE